MGKSRTSAAPGDFVYSVEDLEYVTKHKAKRPQFLLVVLYVTFGWLYTTKAYRSFHLKTLPWSYFIQTFTDRTFSIHELTFNRLAVIAAAFPPPADFIGSTLRQLKDFSYENLNNQICVIDALAELPWTQSDVKTPYLQEIIKLSGFDPAMATAPARPKRAKAAAGAAAQVAAPAVSSPPDSSNGAELSADKRDEEEDNDAAKAQPQEKKGKMKQTKE
ncbi:uncharacterized protein JCM10292_001039, partial [Rhodotorula paludigena]|uniref:uncharacterized protein n=1 Tax=Rhodotorula paludigena TaxID=86838 RepID=UPI00316F25A3